MLFDYQLNVVQIDLAIASSVPKESNAAVF